MNKMTSYAIRIIGRLCQSGRQLVTSTQLVTEEEIPLGAVMKILNKLKQAEIVESKRGRGNNAGGFLLKKDVQDITLYDLVYAMEGEIDLCPKQDKDAYCREHQQLYEELERVGKVYIEELKHSSIRELLSGNTEEKSIYRRNVG